MEPEHWQTVQQLYHSALQIDSSRRAAFVQEACARNVALKEELTALLGIHGQSGQHVLARG